MNTSTSPEMIPLRSDLAGRVRTPRAEREAFLDAFEQSGLSGAAFARQRNIKYATFAYWRQARRKERLQAIGTEIASETSFHEIVVQAENPSPAIAPLRVNLPGGAQVDLSASQHIPLLVDLLSSLEAARC